MQTGSSGTGGSVLDAGLLERLLVRAAALTTGGVTIGDAGRPGFPLVYVNPAFERLTGWRAPELLGRDCALLQAPDTDPVAQREVSAALREGRATTVVLRTVTRTGGRWWNELQLEPLRDDRGRLTHVLGLHRDVTARVQAEDRAAHLATHDAVTGLPDRARLLDGLGLELVRGRRTGTGPAVLVVELDGLVDLEATGGWAAQDLVLAAVALRLRSVLRTGDLLGRLTATEFLAVLPGVPAACVSAVAHRAVDAVRAVTAEPLQVPGLRLDLRARVGVALRPDDGEDVDRLLAAARAAARREG